MQKIETRVIKKNKTLVSKRVSRHVQKQKKNKEIKN